MNKSVIVSLFLIATLLMGTSLNMNMFSTAMASGKDKDDKRHQYDDDNRYQQSTYGKDKDDKRHQYDDDNRYQQSTYGKDKDDKRHQYDDDNRYQQSTYGNDPYTRSYDMDYSYDTSYSDNYDKSYYDQQRYDASYDKTSYKIEDTYNKYPTKDKKYECRTGPFEGFFVSSVEFCDIKIHDDRKDHADKKIFKCGPETNNAGALVTDLRLCEAPNDDNICPEGTDLEGVYVKDPTSDCDIDSPDIPTSADLQCIKCADLAAISAGGTKQLADALIGSTTANVFTVCDDTDPRTALADLLLAEEVGTGPANMLNEAFDTCLDNAAAVTSGTSSSAQTQASSLQENSMTTNIQSEAEIPSVNAEPQNANLNSMLENPNVKALLENPDLNSMLENPDLNSMLENPNVKALLENPEVKALLETQK